MRVRIRPNGIEPQMIAEKQRAEHDGGRQSPADHFRHDRDFLASSVDGTTGKTVSGMVNCGTRNQSLQHLAGKPCILKGAVLGFGHDVILGKHPRIFRINQRDIGARTDLEREPASSPRIWAGRVDIASISRISSTSPE
jgi:hypothetical protein